MPVTPFDIIEVSNADGEPIRLYEFRRGTQFWRYNTSDRDVMREGQIWLGGQGATISDDGIRQSGEAIQDNLQVTLPSSASIAQIYQVYAPTAQVFLTVRDAHLGTQDTVVSWMGAITDVKRPVHGTTMIVCQNIAVTLNRTGLRLSWSRSCPHTLYDRECRVNRAAFQVGVSVLSVVGGGLTVTGTSGLPDGWFDGGYLEWVTYADPAGVEDVMESRGIEAHSSGYLKLLNGTQGIAVGQNLIAYPGCTRNAQVCNDKFNNIPNYGGVPGLPGKSPFDGNPVF